MELRKLLTFLAAKCHLVFAASPAGSPVPEKCEWQAHGLKSLQRRQTNLNF